MCHTRYMERLKDILCNALSAVANHEIIQASRMQRKLGTGEQTMELNTKLYKRQCPFCKEIRAGTPLVNLICKCGAKYYYDSDIWLDRKTGKEVKGELWNEIRL